MVSPVVMYGYKNWTIKKAECQRFDAFELWYGRRLESCLDCKEIETVNPKGNQPWIFIERTAEAEAPILWPPHAKNSLIGKDPDAGKDWEQEKGVTEDEMVGQHHNTKDMNLSKLQEMGWWETRKDLACCSPWGRKELGKQQQEMQIGNLKRKRKWIPGLRALKSLTDSW